MAVVGSRVKQVDSIQTGTVAVKARQREGRGPGRLRLFNTLRDAGWTDPLPIYAWVIQHVEGTIVVDTGETARAMEPGYFPRWHPYFRLALRESVKPEDEVGPSLERLGIAPDEVRWVVLTHLHTDHAGGIAYFPASEIIVSRREFDAASGFRGKLSGYLPHRWPSNFSPRLLDFEPQPFGPFSASVALTDAGDVRLVATPGHSVGHLSVVVEEDDHFLFFAGDASYTEELMIRQVVDGVTPDAAAARETIAGIRRFAEEAPLVYLPSHDPASAARLRARQTVNL
jgi:glyoxylase-like metal-dependent hydrolase (beta-lactamase superfamily II)